MVVSYSDGTTRWANLSYNGFNTTANNVTSARVWGINQTINDVGTTNSLLEPGEQFILVVGTPPTATPNAVFTVNLQPALGAGCQLKKTVPPAVNPLNILT
jgi:flagellin FlaB